MNLKSNVYNNQLGYEQGEKKNHKFMYSKLTSATSLNSDSSNISILCTDTHGFLRVDAVYSYRHVNNYILDMSEKLFNLFESQGLLLQQEQPCVRVSTVAASLKCLIF